MHTNLGSHTFYMDNESDNNSKNASFLSSFIARATPLQKKKKIWRKSTYIIFILHIKSYTLLYISYRVEYVHCSVLNYHLTKKKRLAFTRRARKCKENIETKKPSGYFDASMGGHPHDVQF